MNLATGEPSYALFAVWERARPSLDRIVAELGSRFTIVAHFEVHWSDRHYEANIARLYERPIFAGTTIESGPVRLSAKIGKMPFDLIIVRDDDPHFAFMRSVSGAIELSNEAVYRAKTTIRSWFDQNYQVHSSNNPAEFLFQATLLLGAERVRTILEGTVTPKEILHQDLAGSDGWSDTEHLLRTLTQGSEYLVLRNYEALLSEGIDEDIDLLTPRYQRLASLLNLQQRKDRPYKGTLMVGGRPKKVDIRYVGDNYYDPLWAADMLRRRRSSDILVIPSADDHFFSLLYHVLAHKTAVSAAHAQRLAELAADGRYDWFRNGMTTEELASILSDYMKSAGYAYFKAVDSGVNGNVAVIRKLPQGRVAGVVRRPIVARLRSRLGRLARRLGLRRSS